MRRLLTTAAVLLGAAACQQGGETPSATEETPVVRFATYNVYLNRPEEGDLARELETTDSVQARKVAEIIQRASPDVILLNEIDYDAAGKGLAEFQKNYLEISQHGAAPAIYPYVFVAPVNTGEPSGHDLDRDGVVTIAPGTREYGGDAFGYGEFPGQYGMAILSKYPIYEDGVRTFQKFLWKDMPGAMLPDDPSTPEPADWYSADALKVFRLASKSYWDAPVVIDGKIVHVLASHPTPPSFDGPEDRNGKRNHDEIRFWADYITDGDYIYDDKGVHGGLGVEQRFVIMGDMNADPHDGDAGLGAIDQLLSSPAVGASRVPDQQRRPGPGRTPGRRQSRPYRAARRGHQRFRRRPREGRRRQSASRLHSVFGLWPRTGRFRDFLAGAGRALLRSRRPRLSGRKLRPPPRLARSRGDGVSPPPFTREVARA